MVPFLLEGNLDGLFPGLFSVTKIIYSISEYKIIRSYFDSRARLDDICLIVEKSTSTCESFFLFFFF